MSNMRRLMSRSLRTSSVGLEDEAAASYSISRGVVVGLLLGPMGTLLSVGVLVAIGYGLELLGVRTSKAPKAGILAINLCLLAVGGVAGEVAFRKHGSGTAGFWAAYVSGSFTLLFGFYLVLSLTS